MKRQFAFFCCALLLCAFTGCDKEDESSSADASLLVGRWECYKDYDGEDDCWDYEYGEGSDVCRYEFRADGTGAYRFDDLVDRWVRFTYALSGNVLAIVNEKEPDYEERIRIERLTSSELVLAYDYEGEDGRNCTDLEYFRRMS